MNRMLNDLQSLVQGCTNAETKIDLVKAQIVLLTRLARLLFQVKFPSVITTTEVNNLFYRCLLYSMF